MPDDNETLNVVKATVQLAVATLDHADLSDKELEKLCDTALSGLPPVATPICKRMAAEKRKS